MTTIAAGVDRLKRRLPDFLAPALIESLVEKLAVRFRRRILTPVLTVQLLVLRVLEANTAYTHLAHLSGVAFTGSAFCQALARLPLELLQELLAAVAQRAQPWAGALFGGHRVLVIDAMCTSMPDTPGLKRHYGYGTGQKPGLGFPVAKLLMLLDTSTGLIARVLIHSCRSHELALTSKLHPELKAGDILLGDRAFASFAHLALLLAQGCHGLFRAHQRLSWKIKKTSKHRMQARIVRSLGPNDRLTLYKKPKTCPVWMSAGDYARLPQEMVVREVRYHVDQKGFRSRNVMLVTTLLEPKRYPRAELARLYGLRWQIETQFCHLKSTLAMAELKGKRVAIIEREILAYVLVYNLVACEIRRAAASQKTTPDRISFIDAVRWMRAGMNKARRLVQNPRRPGRVEPRVRKRRLDYYPYMTRPRGVLQRELMQLPKHAARLT